MPRIYKSKYPPVLVGNRYKRLTVLSMTKRDRWIGALCQCDCGNVLVVRAASLGTGNTKSCGCLKIKIDREIHIKHGETVAGRTTKEYRAYRAIMTRCYNNKYFGYRDYGGKGITVCRSWLESFSNFLKDVGRAPSPTHSLDRIDNNGNYEPGNVRWATPAEQSRNTSRTRLITFHGETLCVRDWSKNLGLGLNTVDRRLGIGWSVEKALTTPARKPKDL